MSYIEKTFFFCNIIESIIHQGSVSLLTLRQKTKFVSKVSVDGAHGFFFLQWCVFVFCAAHACLRNTKSKSEKPQKERDVYLNSKPASGR